MLLICQEANMTDTIAYVYIVWTWTMGMLIIIWFSFYLSTSDFLVVCLCFLIDNQAYEQLLVYKEMSNWFMIDA